jgi:hypothetical protein
MGGVAARGFDKWFIYPLLRIATNGLLGVG